MVAVGFDGGEDGGKKILRWWRAAALEFGKGGLGAGRSRVWRARGVQAGDLGALDFSVNAGGWGWYGGLFGNEIVHNRQRFGLFLDGALKFVRSFLDFSLTKPASMARAAFRPWNPTLSM